jgi:hypothetical protein
MTDQLSRPIIIDTDPGQDDAIAILFALAAPHQLDILGIAAVAGNVPVNLTSRKRSHPFRLDKSRRFTCLRWVPAPVATPTDGGTGPRRGRTVAALPWLACVAHRSPRISCDFYGLAKAHRYRRRPIHPEPIAIPNENDVPS